MIIKVILDNTYETDSPLKAFLYSTMRNFNHLSHEEALDATAIAVEMYLKDNNPTPLGNLADYVAIHYKRLSKLTRTNMLIDFYENFETAYE